MHQTGLSDAPPSGTNATCRNYARCRSPHLSGIEPDRVRLRQGWCARRNRLAGGIQGDDLISDRRAHGRAHRDEGIVVGGQPLDLGLKVTDPPTQYRYLSKKPGVWTAEMTEQRLSHGEDLSHTAPDWWSGMRGSRGAERSGEVARQRRAAGDD